MVKEVRMRSDDERWQAAQRAASQNARECRPFRTSIQPGKNDSALQGNRIQMPPPLSREFADWICGVLKIDQIGHQDREVYVTPFEGHYGLSGYVVTVNGSPTRATMLVLLGTLATVILTAGDYTKHFRTTNSASKNEIVEEGIEYLRRMNLSCDTGGDVRTIVPG